MEEPEWLAKQFEENRSRLRAVAYRMLGSSSEADDAVQESWLRLSRSDAADIENLGGWLTTVVARVCLDMLRSRRSRREEPLSERPGGSGMASDVSDPEEDAILADSLGPALLVVLETLAPAERVAFVLHDMFAVPFEEIATIVGRSATAARQLASRARRRVRSGTGASGADRIRQREIVDAFLAASREGNFEGLLAVLDPRLVVRADSAAVRLGAAAELRGPAAVAEFFKGRAQGAQPAWVDGAAGAVWAPGGRPRVVFAFAIANDRIVGIKLIADPERLRLMNLVIPAAHPGSTTP